MTTTDEQFRQDLANALDATAHDAGPVDVGGVIDAGRTRLRRQRLGASAGALALVVALGLGTWAVLPRDQEAVPASPTPPGAVTARFELADGPAIPGPNPTVFEVTFLPDRQSVQFVAVDGDDTRTSLGDIGLRDLGRHTALQWFGGNLVLGVVPDDAVDVSLVTFPRELDGGSVAGPKPLPGTGYSIVGVRLGRPATAPPPVKLMWWRADGTPVADSGVGSKVSFPLAHGSAKVWALPNENLVGLERTRDQLGETTSVRAIGSTTFKEDAVRGVVSGSSEWAYLILGRATAVAGTYAGHAEGEPLQVAYWPELDVTVAYARARIPEQPGTGGSVGDSALTHLTWVDAEGTLREWRPKP